MAARQPSSQPTATSSWGSLELGPNHRILPQLRLQTLHRGLREAVCPSGAAVALSRLGAQALTYSENCLFFLLWWGFLANVSAPPQPSPASTDFYSTFIHHPEQNMTSSHNEINFILHQYSKIIALFHSEFSALQLKGEPVFPLVCRHPINNVKNSFAGSESAEVNVQLHGALAGC